MATQTQTSYIRVKNENVPINLAPAGIKCIGCDQFFDEKDLENHLASHVNPKYSKISSALKTASPKKIQLQLTEDVDKTE